MADGRVTETYHAALQHELVEFSDDAHLAGVVRKPTAWFETAIDENYPSLGPPAALLDETKQRQKDMQMQGMCEEGAHNAAWEETNFQARYEQYLAESDAAQQQLSDLAARVSDGETVVLVCFEADGKCCHRNVLVEWLRDRLGIVRTHSENDTQTSLQEY